MRNGVARWFGADALEGMVEAGRWEWDVGSDAIRWSPALSRIYGLAPGESPAGFHEFLELIYPDDRDHTEQVVTRALREHRDTEYRHRIVRRDGEVRVLRSLVHVDTRDGEVVRLSGACQDVTDDVAMSERMRRLQGLATAGSIAAGLAHDLNNMVGALLLTASALSRANENDRVGLMEQIEHVANRAAAIATRIQGAAVHGRPVESRIDVCVQLHRIAEALEAILPTSIRVDVDVPEVIGRVVIDPTDFERVVWNLVVNARDALPEGGTIRLGADLVHAVERGEAAPFVRITVADDGDGMDECTRAHLFDPFYTTKGSGTGLGLAVVMDIVQHAGGFVTVQSRIGGGTRIRVHLPVAPVRTGTCR